ncbi:MAG: 16S rRNA (uracil(1498)-N(3))-methyltransferase [Acidobacteria bacterium]|nr:16S rRNA (uracil(1498)-N(3))-methyltransferase [Acidobacteriota bacterium]
MTRRRWIADEVAGNRAAITGDHARHLAKVLRARIGQEFDISTGAEVRRGRIMSMDEERVEFELGEPAPHSHGIDLGVALSIFKFDRMEWAIEKSVELGVGQILPLIAARTDRRLASAAVKRVERWRRIAQQASEQSRRLLAPEIPAPIGFEELVAIPSLTRIVLSETERGRMLKDALSEPEDSILLAFGPEGGWTDGELKIFREAGWISASLGRTILRAETAVIAALAIAKSMIES